MLKQNTQGSTTQLLPRDLRQYSNRKVFLTLGAIIGVAFLATSVSYVAITRLTAVRQGAQTVNVARNQLKDLLINLRTAESRERAYLLTSDALYVDRFKQSSKDARALMVRLDNQTRTTAYHQEVMKLNDQAETKLKAMEATIQARQSGTELSDLLAGIGQGRSLMDSIDAQAKTIDSDQASQVDRDRGRIQNLADVAKNISIITLILTLLLATFVYYLYLKAIQAERRLDRAKDEFVSLASHQLRTPASGIKSILSTLVSGDFGALNDRQSYFVQRALESNERELRIIEELLNVAKADAGRMVMHASTVDLGALVETIMTEQHNAFEDKKLEVQVKQPAAPLRFEADEEKLYMAITNLIDNARKYTPDGGKITISLINRSKKGIQIEVADTGPGIEAGEIAHIFDRFQRANDVLQGNVEGTGLGLYLARRIVELHNGTIDVTSKRGHGARFTISIPLRKTDATKNSAR